jgi:acyl carrier protein
MADIAPEVLRIVAGVAKREPGSLTGETRLAEDLLIKSIGRIELAAMIDAAFGTRTSNFEIRRPKTIGELIELVTAKL